MAGALQTFLLLTPVGPQNTARLGDQEVVSTWDLADETSRVPVACLSYLNITAINVKGQAPIDGERTSWWKRALERCRASHEFDRAEVLILTRLSEG